MFNWLKKAWAGTKRVLGKVRNGIESGVKLFNKGKQLYTAGKNYVSNLPVVGNAAKSMIDKAEGNVNKYVKDKTGQSLESIDRAVDVTGFAAKHFLPER